MLLRVPPVLQGFLAPGLSPSYETLVKTHSFFYS